MSLKYFLFLMCFFTTFLGGSNQIEDIQCSEICSCCIDPDEGDISETEATLPEKEKIINLENNVKEKIFGQDEVVNKVCHLVKITFLVGKGENPTVILLGGESGCGKTALVEAICECLYGEKYKEHYEKFSMETLKGNHSSFSFTGSPNGYTGDKGAIEKICSAKKNIILFDEIDRAHKSVHESFLNFIENGKMTTGSGENCSLPKKSIIFMTTNAGCCFFEKNYRFNEKFNKNINTNINTNEDIIKEALILGVDGNGEQDLFNRGMSKALVDRIQNIFAMKTVNDDEAKKRMINKCIQEKIIEINSTEKYFCLQGENLNTEEILSKMGVKNISMRNIKNKMKQDIASAFYVFKTANIGYNGPNKKQVKLKWENNDFKCTEE